MTGSTVMARTKTKTMLHRQEKIKPLRPANIVRGIDAQILRYALNTYWYTYDTYEENAHLLNRVTRVQKSTVFFFLCLFSNSDFPELDSNLFFYITNTKLYVSVF